MDANAVAVLAALEAAPAAELIPALEQILRDSVSAAETKVWLVDYRLTVLQTVTTADTVTKPERVAVDGSSVGRTFASQEPVLHRSENCCEIEIPISVRSDRLGVLAVTLPGEPSPDQVASLIEVGRAVGHAISVANRHTDEFERAARTQRLSLAAELQWQLLPGRGCSGPDFDLAGQLEPAYHVAGDSFDWTIASDHVTVSMHEGMGGGARAAQATNLAVTALRNARRAGLPLTEQTAMTADAVHGLYAGQHWIETVLLCFDRGNDTVTAIGAGSPKILRQRHDQVEEIVLEQQVPLGRFDDTAYREQSFDLRAGDRLVIVSDGVHQAVTGGREPFGATRLPATLRATRNLRPGETVRQIIRELRRYLGHGDFDDDAVAVVFDWKRR